LIILVLLFSSVFSKYCYDTIDCMNHASEGKCNKYLLECDDACTGATVEYGTCWGKCTATCQAYTAPFPTECSKACVNGIVNEKAKTYIKCLYDACVDSSLAFLENIN